jgi:hypothetical protein
MSKGKKEKKKKKESGRIFSFFMIVFPKENMDKQA